MRNKNNSMPLIFKIDKFSEKLSCFLSCQNSCRLVEDKYFSSTNKSLKYFYFLFHTNRYVSYFSVGINMKVIFFSILLSYLNCFFVVNETFAFRLHS